MVIKRKGESFAKILRGLRDHVDLVVKDLGLIPDHQAVVIAFANPLPALLQVLLVSIEPVGGGASAGDVATFQPTRLPALRRIALLANTSSLHPLDWKRFYELVRESRQELPEAELRPLLAARGFSTAKAAELAELYGHLWAFKRLH